MNRTFCRRKALYDFLIDDPVEFKAQYVPVGRRATLAGPSDAEAMLWCFANDARRFYGNNTGSILLAVARTA